MKKLSSCMIVLLFVGRAQAQNVGVGTPTPQQKLDVNGAIKIGTTATNQAGTIRYNTGKFEGGDGTTWKSFEGLPSKSIILARSVDTAEIKLAGFNVFKESTIEDTFHVSIATNNPGQWMDFPPVNPVDEPQGILNYESVLYNNKLIYYNFDGTLHQFDITTQQWSQLPGTSPLSPRVFASMTLVGNEIFILGGAVFNPFTAYSDGAKYNLITNTWAAVANIPVVSYYHGSCAIGSDIYIAGGASTAGSPIEFIILNKKLYKYNTLTNTWSADLANSNTPNALQGNVLAWNNSLLFVASDSIRQYKPVSNSYNTLYGVINSTNPLLTSRSFVSSLVQDKVTIYGSISDTLFATNTDPVPLHYQVDLLNGQALSLNTCDALAAGNFYFTYQYISSINKFYAKKGSDQGAKLFDPAGSSPCSITGFFNTFLYYMKKQ